MAAALLRPVHHEPDRRLVLATELVEDGQIGTARVAKNGVDAALDERFVDELAARHARIAQVLLEAVVIVGTVRARRNARTVGGGYGSAWSSPGTRGRARVRGGAARATHVAVDLQRRSDGANRREDELAPRRSNESVMAKAKALTTAAWKTQSPPDFVNIRP